MSEPTAERYTCELCFREVTEYGEVIPGYHLIRAGGWCRDLRPREYALMVDCEVFAFSWMAIPKIDPTAGLTREQEGALLEDERSRGYHDWKNSIRAAEAMWDEFECEPTVGYSLMRACLAAGWNWEDSGQPQFWLCDRIARLIAKVEAERAETPARQPG